MTPLIAKLLHAACMVAWWLIRLPFERKTRRNVLRRDAMDAREKLLLAISLTGLGIIFDELDQDKLALEAFRRALKVNPYLDGVPEMVKKLTLKVEGREI